MTDRQRRILALFAEGYTTKQVCDELTWSARTVKNDLQDFEVEHNLRNRTQAVAYAIRQGWI